LIYEEDYASETSPILGELNKNFLKHLDDIDRGIEEKCDLIIFPELSLTGYCLRDLVYDVAINGEHEIIRKLIDKSHKISIVFGFVYLDEHGLVYNAGAYLEKILANPQDLNEDFAKSEFYGMGVRSWGFWIKEDTAFASVG